MSFPAVAATTSQVVTSTFWNTNITDNLNAAFPGGVDHATWAPTYSGIVVGNGTTIARYVRVGQFVHAWYHLTFGSTTTIVAGAAVSLPRAFNTTYVAGEEIFGPAYIRAAGTQYIGFVRPTGTAGVAIMVLGTAGTYAIVTAVTDVIPGTFTTGDDISFQAVYECTP